MSKNKRIHELASVLDTMPELEDQFNRQLVLETYEENHLFSTGVAIKILSIFGGILASIAFIAFLLALGIYNSESSLVAGGTFMIIVAVILNRIVDNIVLDTFMISLFLIGNIMWAVGFNMHASHEDLTCVIYIIIGALTLLINRSYMLSFLAVIFMTVSILVLIFLNHVENLLHVYILGIAGLLFCWHVFESRIIGLHSALSRMFSPVRIALQLTLIASVFMIKDFSNSIYIYEYPWITSIGILLFVLLILIRVSWLFEKLSLSNQLLFFGSIALVLAPTLVAPSIIVSCFILLLTFYSGHATGIVLSSISFIYFISRFYYDLSYTLLTKSILLMATGLGFGILYFVLSRNFDRNEQA